MNDLQHERADDRGHPYRPGRRFAVTIGVLGLFSLVPVLLSFLTSGSYFDWYLRNGALINATLGLLALAWPDINTRSGLVSVDPLRYIQEWSLVLAGVSGSVAAGLGFQIPETRRWVRLGHGIDGILASAILLGLTGLGTLVVVLTAPLQYGVQLVTGAPARTILRSTERFAVAEEQDPPDGEKVQLQFLQLGVNLPKGSVIPRILTAPVTLTGGITSLGFVVVNSIR